MKRALILTGIAVLCCIQLNAQTKLWDGGGGTDSSWTNPLNWLGDVVPNATDDVLLNNSIITNSYTVMLPAGSASISIAKLTITPASGKTIQLTIPSSNTANPGLNVTGAGDALILNNGAILINSTGVGSGGVGLNIANTFRINNGGRYIHNNVRGNASIVSQLSAAAGTEDGIFEFDIPPGAGTLSLNGRTFGHLILSASSASSRTYTATGNSAVTINGNFEIKSGVTFSYGTGVNTITIKKDLTISPGATFNISNGTNSSLINVKGNLTIAGIIKETGASTGSGIELGGTVNQNITITGSITDTVFFRVNNPAGVTMLSPLSLPYKLLLQKGQLTTSSTNMLTLKNGCTLQADSLSESFVNGPLRKEGLSSTSHFLFPVGKNNMHRWLELKNVTGSYTVEYIRADPHSLSFITGPDINHISGLEYWKVKADTTTPAPSAGVKLSFDHVNSGGISNLAALLVARLNTSSNTWNSLGNSGFPTGTAGTNGSITATISVNDFNTSTGDYFTLATNTSSANPLPLIERIMLRGQPAQRNILFTKLLYTAPSIIQGTTTVLGVLAEKEEAIRIVFTNQLGQAIRVQQFSLSKGINKLIVDVSGLLPGVYQITGCISNGTTNTIRCIKR